jgi:hypothetical protein
MVVEYKEAMTDLNINEKETLCLLLQTKIERKLDNKQHSRAVTERKRWCSVSVVQ